MRIFGAAMIAVVSATLLLGAGFPAKRFEFSKYDESQWTPAREDRWPTAGAFVQKDGYILNAYPEGTPEKDLFECKDGVGFAMRTVKGVEAKDGRAELELSLSNGAAPSIAFRVQMQDGEVHGPLYNLVIFNQSTEKRAYQGVNLWKWVPPPADKPNARKWQRLAYWYLPIPREQKIKLGVDFRGQMIRVFVEDKEIGGIMDTAALDSGKIGMVAIEGASKFYSFSVTSYDK
jgi:hypothetical protein